MKHILLIICIIGMFSYQTHAGEVTQTQQKWVQDWWDNEYQPQGREEQYKKIRKEEKSQCAPKLKWYRKKYKENPKSEYYKWKLEEWNDRCKK